MQGTVASSPVAALYLLWEILLEAHTTQHASFRCQYSRANASYALLNALLAARDRALGPCIRTGNHPSIGTLQLLAYRRVTFALTHRDS